VVRVREVRESRRSCSPTAAGAATNPWSAGGVDCSLKARLTLERPYGASLRTEVRRSLIIKGACSHQCLGLLWQYVPLLHAPPNQSNLTRPTDALPAPPKTTRTQSKSTPPGRPHQPAFHAAHVLRVAPQPQVPADPEAGPHLHAAAVGAVRHQQQQLHIQDVAGAFRGFFLGGEGFTHPARGVEWQRRDWLLVLCCLCT